MSANPNPNPDRSLAMKRMAGSIARATLSSMEAGTPRTTLRKISLAYPAAGVPGGGSSGISTSRSGARCSLCSTAECRAGADPNQTLT